MPQAWSQLLQNAQFLYCIWYNGTWIAVDASPIQNIWQRKNYKLKIILCYDYSTSLHYFHVFLSTK